MDASVGISRHALWEGWGLRPLLPTHLPYFAISIFFSLCSKASLSGKSLSEVKGLTTVAKIRIYTRFERLRRIPKYSIGCSFSRSKLDSRVFPELLPFS